MEITKEDITTIAYRRFNKAHNKEYTIVLLVLAAVLVGGGLGVTQLFPDNKWLVLAVAILIFALFIIWVVSYNKAQDKAAKKLVEECDANPTITYVPEAKSDVQKVTT